MIAAVWANVLLAIPFLIAFIGIPLWLTFRRPDTDTGRSQAHAYLAAKAALAEAGTAPASSGGRPHRRTVAGGAFGRRSTVTTRHNHSRRAARQADVPA